MSDQHRPSLAFLASGSPIRPTVVRVRGCSYRPWLVVWRGQGGARRRERFSTHRSAIHFAQGLIRPPAPRGRRIQPPRNPYGVTPPWEIPPPPRPYIVRYADGTQVTAP